MILTKFSGKSSLCEKRHLGKQIWQRHGILKEKTLFRLACVAQKHLKSKEKEQVSAKEGKQISEGVIDIHLEDASKGLSVFQTSLTDIIIH